MTFYEYLEAGGLEDGVCRKCGAKCQHRTICERCEEDEFYAPEDKDEEEEQDD